MPVPSWTYAPSLQGKSRPKIPRPLNSISEKQIEVHSVTYVERPAVQGLFQSISSRRNELDGFRKLAKAYAGLTVPQLSALLEIKDLTEICHDNES
jgi:hypothetical protein